jgi:hypothetical protein
MNRINTALRFSGIVSFICSLGSFASLGTTACSGAEPGGAGGASGASTAGASAGGASAGSAGAAPSAGSGGSFAPSGGMPSAGTGGSPAGGAGPSGGSGGGSGNGAAGSSVGGSAAGGVPPADGGELTGVEVPGASCPIASMPSFEQLQANEKLPDPFKTMDGKPVTTRAQWVCRHREIRAMVENYETGPKEIKKATVKGTVSGKSLKIDVTGGAADVTFTVSIDLPTQGTAPYPAMIGLSGGSLNNSRLKELGVAIINFDHNGVQPESNRGGGLFSKFHGKSGTGALMAWAWGASRIIDALEATPDAKIDPKRLGITGCSRNGKGALMIGAMDSRFALTIPQESGSGGVAAWRVSEVDNMGRTGSAGVQNLSRTYSEQQWFSTAIEPFGKAVTKLPLDHHELVALTAPRGLLILGNLNYEWLSTNNSDQSGGAARLVYEALGAKPNIGFVDSGHTHCGTDYAGKEQAAIDAFVKKFLLGDASASTDFWLVKNELDKSKWLDWTPPASLN